MDIGLDHQNLVKLRTGCNEDTLGQFCTVTHEGFSATPVTVRVLATVEVSTEVVVDVLAFMNLHSLWVVEQRDSRHD